MDEDTSVNPTLAGPVRHVSDSDFSTVVLESPVPVLVDFWAEWCGPCRLLGPTMEAIADDYFPRVAVVKINVDDSPATAAKYGIRSIPTVMLFVDGVVVDTSVGVRPRSEYEALLDARLG